MRLYINCSFAHISPSKDIIKVVMFEGIQANYSGAQI